MLYYDGAPCRDRGYFLNFINSSRGDGKTFWHKCDAILYTRRHKGSQFIWMRRYDTELGEDFRDGFFSDIIKVANLPSDQRPQMTDEDANFFKGMSAQIRGNGIWVNGRKVGILVCLSKTLGKKSVNYCNVDRVIFDEYILKKKSPYRYLPDEFTYFMEFLLTVFRDRKNGRVFCLGNSLTSTDPYSLALGFGAVTKRFTPIRNPIYGTADILLEKYYNEEHAAAMYETPIGRIIRGTQYGKYAIENQTYDINEDFIRRRSTASVFRFAIAHQGITVGFWLDQQEGRYYASTAYDKTSREIYALTRDDHTLNTYLITNKRHFHDFRELALLYGARSLYFETPTIKSITLDIIAYLC